MAESILILILTLALMFAGLIGSVLPGIPGSPLILLGAFLYAWHTGFARVTWPVLLCLLVLTLLSHFLEFLVSVLGVKKLGGGRWGMAGAFVGAIVGLFAGGLPGVVAGPFLGAFFFEFLKSKDLRLSLRSGTGSLLGLLAGIMGKLILAVVMIGVFLWKVMA